MLCLADVPGRLYFFLREDSGRGGRGKLWSGEERIQEKKKKY